MRPLIDDIDFRLYVGDAVSVLDQLPEKSVHMCVTSPPYYGLRDYGTGSWEGGDPDCDHDGQRPVWADDPGDLPGIGTGGGPLAANDAKLRMRAGSLVCVKCDAEKIDLQIGLEETPDDYVTALVNVFRSVRRVLRDDGTLWLNLGDSYATDHAQKRSAVDELGRSTNTGIHARIGGSKASELRRPGVVPGGGGDQGGARNRDGVSVPQGLKPKDLMGIPWRVAFALQADGWWLRQDNIWSKTSCMPESIEGAMWEPHYVHVGPKGARVWTPCPGCDKCRANDGWIQSWGSGRTTKSHEYLFQFAKSSRYYYDVEALREPFADNRQGQSYPNGAPIGPDGKGNPDRTDNGRTSSARVVTLDGSPAPEPPPSYAGGIGAYDPPYANHGPQSSARKDEPLTLDGSSGEAPRGADGRRVTTVAGGEGSEQHRDGERWPNPSGKNKRSVWDVEAGEELTLLPDVEPPKPKTNPTWDERRAAGAWVGNISEAAKYENFNYQGNVHGKGLSHDLGEAATGRNERSVWVIGPEPYSDAHFATYPSKLIIPAIKAGTSEGGVCPECGAPWLRMMERIGGKRSGRTPEQQRVAAEHGVTSADGRTLITGLRDEDISEKVTHGWKPSCGHAYDKSVPATVLDPFMGSGTTALTARRLGRHAVGVELNHEYAVLCGERTKQLSLLAEG